MPNPYTRRGRASIEAHEWPLLIGIAILIGLAILMLCAVLFMAAWNLGVVGLAAACGWTVLKVGFWTSVGGTLLVSTLASIFGGRRQTITGG